MAVRVIFLLLCVSFIHAKVWQLDCDTIRQFVDGHNWRRMEIARGQVGDQPAASKMNSMVWDDELAQKAANWASHNRFQHNPDRTIPSQRFSTGENIYYKSTTDRNFYFNVDEALKSWFSEHKDYTYKPISFEDFTGPQVGHYTQMVWSDSTFVGCAVSEYPEGGFTTYLVVCNYGPAGNMMGQTAYESGYPANRLVCGTPDRDCTRQYGERC
ncbi:hypothetical protein O0L34_g4397 [Tuta absoluta]|nr:hypothetical protein O0L34_g4397 [Tuta absoluta]